MNGFAAETTTAIEEKANVAFRSFTCNSGITQQATHKTIRISVAEETLTFKARGVK